MATLHVRGVPVELYDRLQELARKSSRSLSAQVVTLLDDAVRAQEVRAQQGEILDRMRRRRFVPPVEAPTSLDLLREDRDR